MSERNYTYEIIREECVGDSLGKHNFNFLSLDTGVCNLSSWFFEPTRNTPSIWSSFSDLSANIARNNRFLGNFTDPTRFDQAHFGVSVLSAYWNKQHITVEYPFNRVAATGYTLNYFVPLNTPLSAFYTTLAQNAMTYVTTTFSISTFNEGTVFDVVFPVLANNGELVSTHTYLAESTKQTVVSNTLPSYAAVANTGGTIQKYRAIESTFKKNDNNVASNPIVRLVKNQGVWTHDSQSGILSAVPTPISEAGWQSFLNSTAQRAQKTTWNIYYPCSTYNNGQIVAYGWNQIFTGLSVSFKHPNGTVQTFTHKSTDSTNPNTYLEWNATKIYAYNGREVTKTNNQGYPETLPARVLQKTWDRPFLNTANVTFLVSKDTNQPSSFLCW